MDKSELYYIITQGTNSRFRNSLGEPVVFLPNHVDRFVDEAERKYLGDFLIKDYVKITIEEYERTFGE